MTDAEKLGLDSKSAGRAMRIIRDRSFRRETAPPKDLEDFSAHLNRIGDAMLDDIEAVDAEALEVLLAVIQKVDNLPKLPDILEAARVIKRMAARVLAFEELEELPRNRAKQFTNLYVSMCPTKKLQKTG